MKEIKEFIGTIKKLLSNKKTRSLTLLFLYLIFFFLVILMVRKTNDYDNSIENKQPNEENILKEETSLEKFSKINNYKYKLTINYTKDITYEVIINGYVGNNYDEFIYNGNLYNAKEVIEIENLDLTFLKFTPANIINMINKGILIKENILNNTTIYNYRVDMLDNILNEEAKNIIIDIYEIDKEVKKVVIDLTNYKQDYLDYKITIDYIN